MGLQTLSLGDFIQRARQEITELQRRRSVERRREKFTKQEENAERKFRRHYTRRHQAGSVGGRRKPVVKLP